MSRVIIVTKSGSRFNVDTVSNYHDLGGDYTTVFTTDGGQSRIPEKPEEIDALMKKAGVKMVYADGDEDNA